MRNKDIGLGLLTMRVTTLHGILTDETNQIITRSAVRSATKTSPNLRLDLQTGGDQPQGLTSDVLVYCRSHPDGSEDTPPVSTINFDDFLGRTFLLPMDENGRETELLFLIISIPSVKMEFQEKSTKSQAKN